VSAPPAPAHAAGHAPALRTLARLLAYVLRHRGLVAWSVVTMVALAAVDLLLPEIVKRAVDGPIARGEFADLLAYGGAFLAVLLVGGWIRAARTVLSLRAGREIGLSLRMDLFGNLQRQALAFFDRHPVGVLTTRVTGDIESIEEFFASGVAAFFHDLMKLALILGMLLWVDSRLALQVLLVVPILLIVGAVFTRRSRRDFGRVRGEVAAANAFATEAIGGIRVTRLFGREPRARAEFGEATARLRDAHLATVKNFAFFFPAVEALEALAVALVLRSSAEAIVGGTFTVGAFLQFWMLIGRFFEPVRELSENLNLMLQAMASGERVFRLVDAVPEVADRPGALDASGVRGEVAFEDVHFAYVADEPVLRGVSFAVPAGSTLALVGPTGAGKSSVLSLLSRFYDVQRGRVLVDGRDVREYAQQTLRRRIAIVLQDVFLFTGSVLENIRLFDPSIPREKVEAACRAVRADRVLARLPGGLDHRVQERGANFSVGERQLIAFARALVHDPAILVLDEATSSIDTETERWIQEGLAALRRGRTTILVAHRLSTVRDADRILVLRRGQVVEQGDHAALLAADGLYRRLYELQVRAESVGAKADT
jgi:ABC-type multidrug transport system fused ATPase/permease subunit